MPKYPQSHKFLFIVNLCVLIIGVALCIHLETQNIHEFLLEFWVTLFVLFCGTLLFVANTQRIYKENLRLILEQQKAQLNKEEMRRQLAADLHDDIGSSLSSIALLSERAKATLNGAAPEAQVLLDKISNNVRSSIENTQTTIWAIDTRYDKLSNLIDLMKEFSGSLSDMQTFRWSLPPKTVLESIELTPELKKHLYLIFKESINNAVKYAESDVVSIEITCQNAQLTMQIQDFGKGFERQAQSRSLGLYNIENRANILRGVATIQSECGKGTTICVKVPLDK
jgi:signal transduction histidine kinase